MNEEEKEAIEYIKNCLDNEYNFKNATRQKDKDAYNVILSLINKQQKEIERKDKVFDDCKYTIIEYVKTAKDTMQKMEEMIEIEKDVINEFDKLLKGE